MRDPKRLIFRSLAIILTAVSLLTVSGCQSDEQSAAPKLETGPVFFPAPPATPKLQFLQAFSSSKDVMGTRTNALEDYILGKQKEDPPIKRPYGAAMHDGKIYTCDTTAKKVRIFDLKNKTVGFMTKDQRLTNPMSIFIETDGTIYVTDPTAGKVFVFDQNHRLIRILGDGRSFTPIDLVVKDNKCYITDVMYSQILVIDKVTGKEVLRIGKSGGSDELGSFKLIAGIAVDNKGSIYATDKVKAKIFKFNSKGVFLRTFGKLGRTIHDFIRPKGISVDREDRIWVVDSATEVVKIFNAEGQLLMLFGHPGNKPGNLNLPVSVKLVYDDVDWFRDKAVPGAKIEHLVIVTSQYGTRMINIYGFGVFPK
ncbi:MAG: 6-bladed beta-propeller [Phycisphaerae bacterium]|nr:6-bladed beta-propeller [Phycisphaerae bacterium]